MKKLMIVSAAVLLSAAMSNQTLLAVKAAVPEGMTAFNITAVSNQNIASGYGPGISVEATGLATAYWEGQTTTPDKIALYDKYGDAMATSVEDVGAQLCINRGGGYNYYGAILKFEEGYKVVSNGTTFYLENSKAFICTAADGAFGGDTYWSEYIAPTSFDVTAETATFKVGETYKINHEIVTTASNPIVSYKSENTGVATVAADGTVTGVSEGITRIKVVSGLIAKYVTVTVEAPAAAQSGIKITTADKKITTYQGYDWDIKELTAVKVYGDADGEALEITSDMISGTFNKDVLGDYTLTLTAGGFSDTFTVSVVEIPETTMHGTAPNGDFGNNSGWGNFYFVTSIPDKAQYLNLRDEALTNAQTHIKVAGEFDKIAAIKNLGGGRYEIWFVAGFQMKAGDKIELMPGLNIYQYTGTVNGNHDNNGDGKFSPVGQFKSSVTFVYTGSGYEMFSQDPTDFTMTTEQAFVSVGQELQINYTMTPENTYGTPTFTSSDPEVATVDQTGKIVGVKEGEVTITGKLGDAEHSLLINVLPAKTIKGVKFDGVPNYYSVVKGSDVKEFTPNLSKMRLVFEDDTYSPVIGITTEDYKIGEFTTDETKEIELPVNVTFQGKQYEGKINVHVYEYYDQKISEVGVVDWFLYGTFIQFTNTSTNRANLTDASKMPGLAENVKYTRKDGTNVPISVMYMLATNLAIFPSFCFDADGKAQLNATNYNDFYLVGDTITIESNTPIYKWSGDLKATETDNGAIDPETGEVIVEGYVKEKTTYKYNGSIWTVFVEYEDVALASDTIDLQIGKTATAGATRVPGNATQGSFSYATSDAKVATVSAMGVIKGVGEGTCTITVTLSDPDYPDKTKTGTITVRVTDYITGIEVKDVIEVTKGTEKPDLSKVEATYVYASKKAGEKVDLTNATISGYDKEKLGEQTVVISVTKDGQTYTGKAVVRVVEAKKTKTKGCGGTVSASLAAVGLVSVVGLIIRKKKSKLD